MSIEAAIAKLTAALEANTAAMLSQATQPTAEKAEKADTTKQEAAAEKATGPGYWRTADGSMVGKFANEKEFQAIQNQHDTALVKIEHAEAKKLAAAIKKAKADAEAAHADQAAEAAGEDHPSEADLIAAFSQYLPKDLDKDERAARAAKVKPYLTEQGAKKATDLKPEQRAAAIAFIEGLLAELGAEESGDDDLV